MTNQEAIEEIKKLEYYGRPFDNSLEECNKASRKGMALDMAINALSNQVICPSYNVDCIDCPAYKPCKTIEDIKAEIQTEIYDNTAIPEAIYFNAGLKFALDIIDEHLQKGDGDGQTR